VPKLPGINHLDAVNALTMGGIVRDARLSIDEFKELL